MLHVLGVFVLYCLSKINVYPQFEISEWEGIVCNILRIWNIYYIILMGARCYIKYSWVHDHISALCTVCINYYKLNIHSDSAGAIINLRYNWNWIQSGPWPVPRESLQFPAISPLLFLNIPSQTLNSDPSLCSRGGKFPNYSPSVTLPLVFLPLTPSCLPSLCPF